MDELINLVAQKAGLPKDKAEMAVNVVMGFLKDKLPAPIAGQIDSLMGGGGSADSVKSMAKGLGGIFGKK